MSRSIDVSPLMIEIGEQELWFRFTDPDAIMLEVPPEFEEQLRQAVEENRQQFEGKTLHLELENLTAISSRQLGMILTLREVMKPFGQLQLHNTSESVKRLLQLTGTDRFFDV